MFKIYQPDHYSCRGPRSFDSELKFDRRLDLLNESSAEITALSFHILLFSLTLSEMRKGKFYRTGWPSQYGAAEWSGIQ